MGRMQSLDILVRGSGAVGMTAALALARQGLQVALVEPPQAAPGGPDLRAYALNAASVALLEQLKVWSALPGDARTRVQDMRIEGDAPGAALDFSAWSQGATELAWIVDAAELDRALRAAVSFAPHIAVFADAQAAALAAPLQLLADGKDSPERKRLGVQMPRQAYGQRAIAARLRSAQPHAGLARQWFRSPDVLALLPLDRPQPGHGLGLVWSVPDARADELMALDDAGFESALMDASGGAAGPLTLTSPRAQWPLALARADAVCGPGWALIGDAAHIVHPLAGQGLNLGLADVAALAGALADREPWRALGDVKLLRRYARARLADTVLMGRVTDGLLHLFASPQPWLKELRNRGLGLVNQAPAIKRLLANRALGR
jgi:2-polyprenyl-6-methoxyphenol hydroxylase-like FAD-dependent oxidoreductase